MSNNMLLHKSIVILLALAAICNIVVLANENTNDNQHYTTPIAVANGAFV